MVNADYEGRRFSLWLIDDQGENVVAAGWIAHVDNGTLALLRDGGKLDIGEAWFDRIREVENESVRKILMNADYYLQLRVRTISDEDAKSMLSTGMTWPQSDEPSTSDEK